MLKTSIMEAINRARSVCIESPFPNHRAEIAAQAGKREGRGKRLPVKGWLADKSGFSAALWRAATGKFRDVKK
jgi:hypothetical protein